VEAVEDEKGVVSLSASASSLGEVMREIIYQVPISVVWEEELDGATVSLEVDSVPVGLCLELVARRVGAELIEENEVYYLGEVRPEDNGVLVRRVGRVGPEEVKQAVEVVVTQAGRSAVLEDGLVLVSDKVRVLRRVIEILDGLEGHEGGWAVQFLLVESLDGSEKTLGVDTSLDVDLAATFSAASSVTDYAVEARAALVADIEGQRVKVWAQPLVLVREGGEGILKRVQVVPVPEFTTLETGAVVTSGYSEVEIGLDITVGVRGYAPGVAGVDYSFRLGEIQGFVDNQVPIRTEESLEGFAAMRSGGTYLLGSLERVKQRDARSGALQLLKTATFERTRLEVWAMVSEVDI